MVVCCLVDQASDLLLRRGDDRRMAKARRGHTDACGEVQVAPAALIEQIDALAPVHSTRTGVACFGCGESSAMPRLTSSGRSYYC
jgi:hypothetical protein